MEKPAPCRRKRIKKVRETSWHGHELDLAKAKALRISGQLNELYVGKQPCPLRYETVFQLVTAVVLSSQVPCYMLCMPDPRTQHPAKYLRLVMAQTTDRKVNEVTPALWRLAPSPAAMAALEVGTAVSSL